MQQPESTVKRVRWVIMWAALLLIVLLWILSMAGAFLGADRARQLFNSLPLVIYWWGFSSLLILGLLIFSRLMSKPALLLTHAGCILVLIGAMWGSKIGHQVQKKFLDIDKILKGYMFIYEGYVENRVFSQEGEELIELGQLPFYIRLNDFWIDYYWGEGTLIIQTPQGQTFRIPDRVGHQLALPDDLPRLKILRRFRNCLIDISRQPYIAIDNPHATLGFNPALEIELVWPDGKQETEYVYTNHASHAFSTEDFFAVYEIQAHPKRDVRDYFSDLTVHDGEQILAQEIIEVNKPLHFGGYHFYQSSYDDEQGQYTVLSVASDTGLSAVYAGYLLICLGVFWQFWFRHILTYFKKRRFVILGEAKNISPQAQTFKTTE